MLHNVKNLTNYVSVQALFVDPTHPALPLIKWYTLFIDRYIFISSVE